jgi:hypothetical protein
MKQTVEEVKKQKGQANSEWQPDPNNNQKSLAAQFLEHTL